MIDGQIIGDPKTTHYPVVDIFPLELERRWLHFQAYKAHKNLVESVLPRKNSDYLDSSLLYPHLFALQSLLNLGITPESERAKKILYIASSYGFGPWVLMQSGYNVKATDIDSEAIRIATVNGVPTEYLNALNIPIDDDSLDIIISRDFLRKDYLDRDDLERAITAQHRVLRTGGCLVYYSAADKKDSYMDLKSNAVARFSHIHIFPFEYKSATRNYQVQFEVIILEK